MPKISVIIPIYNAEKYIEECLQSVCHQSLKDIEVLCINDCSSDESMKIVDRVCEYDIRVKRIDNPCNMGAGQTRNRGIELAKGKYLFFLDADDFLEQNALEVLYCRAEEDKLQLCFFQHAVYDEKEKRSKPCNKTKNFFVQKYQKCVFSWKEVQKVFYQSVFCVPWNRLYLTEFVKNSKIRFPNLRNSEDLYFGNSIVVLAERMGIAVSDVPLLYYRLNREGQVSASLQQSPYCMLESIKLWYIFLQKQGKLLEVWKIYIMACMELLQFSVLKAGEKRGELTAYLCRCGLAEIGLGNLKEQDFYLESARNFYQQARIGNWEGLSLYDFQKNEKKQEELIHFAKQQEQIKIALWGIGKKGVALIEAMDKLGYAFDYYIDINEKLQHTKIKAEMIYLPEEVVADVGIIVIMNDNYLPDVIRRCKKCEAHCCVLDWEEFMRLDIQMRECLIEMR